MAVKLKVTERTIRRDIDKLREQYNIEWVGSSKNGYWKILPKKD
jgi:predicted DNA-binding transcriptional regulator YafY